MTSDRTNTANNTGFGFLCEPKPPDYWSIRGQYFYYTPGIVMSSLIYIIYESHLRVWIFYLPPALLSEFRTLNYPVHPVPMAAHLQGHKVHPDGRRWKNYFPDGDLWVFGYGYINYDSIMHCVERSTSQLHPYWTSHRSLIWKPPPHFGESW